MARMRIFVVLALALVAGGTFAFGTYQFMQKTPAAQQPAGMQTRSVMVASADLDIGAELRREDIRAIQWPADALPAGHFENPDELVGRGLIMPITQNEAFLPAKLASKDAGAGLPPIIQPGYRALSVRVNDVVGVAGYVLPGTRVDVVATLNPNPQRPEDMTSKVVLTNVQVLASGTKIERDEKNNKPMAVSVVTMLVSPEEAEKLTLASTEGKIQLALRNPVDKSAPVTAGVRPVGLMAGRLFVRTTTPTKRVASAPAPVVAPASPTVEIIRGDKRAQEVVSQE
jgi:pilus assembly protein CpaB